MPAEVLQALVPSGLTIDTFEGRAYVGLVPFTMRDVRPWWSPGIPGLSNFHEVNVRTYVHKGGEQPGVWFFSLDAARSIAVLAARLGWHLPYFRAAMKARVDGDAVRYASRRLWPGRRPADLAVDYRIGESVGTAQPGSLDHFLAERYLLYAQAPAGLALGQVHHAPYPLRRASVTALAETLVHAAGLPTPTEPPLVLYSPGVDVEVFKLKQL